MSRVFENCATVNALRKKLGAPADEWLPLTQLLPEAFQPSFTLLGQGWPDFMAYDLADWPSHERASASAFERPDAALVVAFTRVVPPLPAPFDPLLLRHQTAGHLLGELRCAAIRLDISEHGREIGRTLGERWHGTGAATGWSPFEDLYEYRTFLQEHGFDCNESYRHFAEGAYPIDLDDYTLEILASDPGELLSSLSPDELGSACLVFLFPNSAT